MHLQTSYNRLVVQVDQQFADTITMLNGKKLYIDTRFNPEEKVELTGIVHSVPVTMRNMPGVEGMTFGPIKAGDKVMMRYDVLAATRDQPDRDSIRYRNEIWIEGKQYWFADVEQIFAYIGPEDEWIAINDIVLLEPLADVDLGETFANSRIIRPHGWRAQSQEGLGCVISSADFKTGTVVVFPKQLTQKYTFNRKPLYIIKSRYIMGIDRKKTLEILEKV